MRRINLLVYRGLILAALLVCSGVIFAISQDYRLTVEGVFLACIVLAVQMMLLALLMQSSMFTGGA